MITPGPLTLTAAETARMLHKMGFNWLDVEFVLELAPHRPMAGHMHYPVDRLQKFISRAYWLSEAPLDLDLPHAA